MVKLTLLLIASLANLQIIYSFDPIINANEKSCNPTKQNSLNVHIISHTHLDAGWTKTFDQYYNESLGVKDILNSVTDSLTHKGVLESRRFPFVEIGFFNKYWNEINETQKNVLKKLVNDRKLQFVSGGWVMNDEAGSHYSMIIDNMALGHRWLNRTFGPHAIPTTGWQIDPFGHSREFASILSQMGFNGLLLGRIDFQDKLKRESNKNLEFIWKSDPNLKSNNYMFTSVLPDLYMPIPDFCFDGWCGYPEIDDQNKEFISAKFIDIVRIQSTNFSTNNLIVTMGGDFHYSNAEKWFRNLDKLITTVNSMQNETHLLYSTPDCYIKSLYNLNKNWTNIKSDDFFPYADKPNDYWSGYFTSRPTFKRQIYYANNILQMSKQLIVLADIHSTSAQFIKELEESVAICQHHDAVTGTSKQFVVNDYITMLDNGISRSLTAVKFAYQKLFNTSLELNFCHKLNVSQCYYTENILNSNLLLITIYNPFGYHLSHYLNLPINGTDFEITDSNEKVVESQIIPIPKSIQSLSERSSSAKYELYFESSLPPLSFKNYYLKRVLNVNKTEKNTPIEENEDIIISNNKIDVIIDKSNGLLKSLRIDGKSLNISQNFYYYTTNGKKNSGAYGMHTNSTDPTIISSKASVSVIRGKLVEQVIQQFNPWLSQVIRLYRNNKDYIEFDWIVGPLPIDKDMEIITRFDTDFKTNNTFFTDSNGRQIIERIRDFRKTWNLNTTEKVSSNYYPIIGWIFIKDVINNLQLTVLPDRPQGGSSLKDGSVELMIHRRLTRDDDYGVEEALNETGFDGEGLVVRGKHILLLSKINESMKKVNKISEQLLWKPLPLFSTVLKPIIERSRNVLSNEINENIRLLTLEELSENKVLLRLENINQFNETKATVVLNKLFTDFEVIDVFEKSLTGIESISEVKNRKFKWICVECNGNEKIGDNLVNNTDKAIDLYPNEIRTFILNVKRSRN